jgi:hypothetical protein
VAVFHLLDPDEIDLPFDSPVVFRGMEGEKEVEVDPALIRNDYREEIRAAGDRWRIVCGEAGIDLTTVVTDSLPSSVLADFITRRHGQGRRR